MNDFAFLTRCIPLPTLFRFPNAQTDPFPPHPLKGGGEGKRLAFGSGAVGVCLLIVDMIFPSDHYRRWCCGEAAGGATATAMPRRRDAVKQPGHYTSHPSGIECKTISGWHSFFVGSAIKYLWRAGLKADNPAIQDLRKAREYLKFEIERLGGKA